MGKPSSQVKHERVYIQDVHRPFGLVCMYDVVTSLLIVDALFAYICMYYFILTLLVQMHATELTTTTTTTTATTTASTRA